MKKYLAIILSSAIALSACSTVTPTRALTPLTLQLRWTHNAQFAGFYAAEQNGYYAAEGLAVTFVQGGATVDFLTPVIDGKTQLGIHGAEALVAARAQGKPVQAVAVVYRRSPNVFITLATSNIKRPQDFVGKTIQVGSGSGRLILRAVTSQMGIRQDQFTEVPLTAELTQLTSGQAQVMTGFLTDQPLTLRKAGYTVNLIFPDDYGVHFYGDTIFTTDEYAKANPQIISRFLRATFKGWTYVVENPDTVATLIVKYKADADTALEVSKMIASLPLVNTGEDRIGWMKLDIWAEMEKTLREQKVITTSVDVTQMYTMQFLKEVYGK